MKLFRFNSKNDRFDIPNEDQTWIIENFKWLIQVYKYPNKDKQILLSSEYFPNTFETNDFTPKQIIEDLSKILKLNSKRVEFKVFEDLRDSFGTPFEIEGNSIDIQTEQINTGYLIHISKSITRNSEMLILFLIYEMVRVKLLESNLDFDTGEDTESFIPIAGIYFGFGVIISRFLTGVGRSSTGIWESKWNYHSAISEKLMGFALAVYSNYVKNFSPPWENELPKDIRVWYQKSISHLQTNN